mmetsp:Transcript_6508/g.9513  ORF Transcript_6508/g.9513 Transcript_6508/m.9513 type:complete len:420 (+) Transcript_6508:31-1290(+)
MTTEEETTNSIITTFKSLLEQAAVSKHHRTAEQATLLLDGGVSTYILETLLPQHNNNAQAAANSDDSAYKDRPPTSMISYNRALWSSSLLMSEEGCKLIKRAHLDFLNAGSDIISTVTYQCHYDKTVLASLNIDDVKMDELLRVGVRLAREALQEFQGRSVDRKDNNNVCNATSAPARQYFVVASIGCYGASLADGSEYTGNYDLSIVELSEYHRRKYAVLCGEMPDCIAFETIPCIDECLAILRLLNEPRGLTQQKPEEVANFPPVWISFACQDGQRLNDGHLLTDALDAIHCADPEANIVHAIGVNCCACKYVSSLVGTIARHAIAKESRRAIVFYPNSGEVWNAENESWEISTGENECSFASIVSDAIEIIDAELSSRCSGGEHIDVPMKIVGGCCRTDPDTIAAIRMQIAKAVTQ